MFWKFFIVSSFHYARFFLQGMLGMKGQSGKIEQTLPGLLKEGRNWAKVGL